MSGLVLITAAASAQQTITYLNGQNGTGAMTINAATNPTTLTIATGSATQSGVISDGNVSGSIIKSGSGTLTLAAANTYTGTTTIKAGTLALGPGALLTNSSAINLASSSARFDLSANGDYRFKNLSGVAGSVVNLGNYTPEFSETGSTTFAGAITGGGGFEKTGTATLNLTGANSYTGNTIVDFGTLAVQGATAAIGTRTSPSNEMYVGYLIGDNASLLIANGGQVNSSFSAVADFNGTNGTATVTGLNANGTPSTWNAGNLDVGGFAGATGSLNITGGGQVSGSTASIFSGSNTVVSGISSNGTASTLTLQQDLFNKGTLTVQDGGQVNDLLAEIQTGSVTVTGVNANGTPSVWHNTNELIVGLNGTTANLSILNGGRVTDVTGIIGDGADSSSFASGSALVSGVGPNGQASTWDHQGFALQVGSYGGTGTLSIQDGGQVIDYNGLIAFGPGSIGTATVSGVNANGTASRWSNGGVFEIGFGGQGTLTIQNGGIVTDYGTVLAYSGTATVNLNSNGVLETGYVMTDGSGSTPNINFNGGIVRATASTVPGYYFLFSGDTITLGTAGGIIDNNGYSVTNHATPIGGTGGLTSTGSGTFLLTGTNTYQGGTTVNGGTLSLGNMGALGSASSPLTVNAGGTLDLNGTSTTVGNLAGAGVILNSGTNTTATLSIDYPNANGATYSGAIKDNAGTGGTLALIKIGSGTQMLTGANTYSGGTTISGGALKVISDSSLGAAPTGSSPGRGAIALVSSGGLLTDAVGFTSSRAISVSGTGQIAAVTGTTATYTGAITGGSLIIGDGTDNGPIFFSSTVTDTATPGASSTFTGETISGSSGSNAVIINPHGTLTNAGTINGGRGGQGSSGYAVIGTGSGTIQPIDPNPVTGGDGGNGAVGVLSNPNAALVNSGTITGGAGGLGGAGSTGGYGGAGGIGVHVGIGSTFANSAVVNGGAGGNSGSGNRGAVGGVGGVAVAGDMNSAITNTGTLTGGLGGTQLTNNGDYVSGNGGFAVTLAANAMLTNHGTILGGGGSNGIGLNGSGGNGAAGVELGAGASLTNSGMIAGGAGGIGSGDYYNGGSGGGGPGVVLLAGATLTNTGAIMGGTAGSATPGDFFDGFGGVGIIATGTDTIINAGTVTAGTGLGGAAYAITLKGIANTLELYSTSQINGAVVVYGLSTLELGGTTNGTFAVSGIGGTASQYQGFTGYAKVGTGTWTLTGQVGLVGGGTLTGGTIGGMPVVSTGTLAVTPWTVSQGALSIASDDNLGNVLGALTLDGGTLRTTANLTSTRNIALTANRGTIDTDGKGVTLSGIISGAGGLTLRDSLASGLLVLNGINTYTGTTTVAAGKLSVTGSIASSAVTVSSGATLSGTGTTGAVTLSAGARLNLQDQKIGTLTIGKLTTGSSVTPSSISFDIQTVAGTTTVDRIVDQGTLTFGGAGGTKIYIANLAGTTALESSLNSYPLLTYTGAQQSLAGLSLATPSLDGKTLSLHQTGNTIFLDVEGAPTLYFQNGTLLGILTVTSTFAPHSWQGIGAMNSGWQERAIADVNGDGIDDILFQNGTALGALILNASGNPTSWLNIGALNAGWQLRGAAELTGDGQPDLLIQNGTAIGFIELNDAGLPVSYNLIGALAAGWQLHAAADLNGDGQPELLFQNGTAIAALQVSSTGQPIAWHPIGSMNTGWNLADAVDVNGDGQPELIFQNGTAVGALSVGTNFLPVAWYGIGAVSAGWTLPGAY